MALQEQLPHKYLERNTMKKEKNKISSSSKEQAKNIFYQHYKEYLDRLNELGVNVKLRVVYRSPYIAVECILMPDSVTTSFSGKSFYAKVLKRTRKKDSALKTLKKDYFMVRFLKKQILCAARKSAVDSSAETIWNLLLRILFWYRVGKFPAKYKGKDIQVVYGIIFLIVFAILSFMAAHSYVNAMENLGYW